MICATFYCATKRNQCVYYIRLASHFTAQLSKIYKYNASTADKKSFEIPVRGVFYILFNSFLPVDKRSTFW